ncbi:MAG: hypothetical protein Ct9H90mP16_22130 [Candidatus Poseidoniales archaeon]|nr:MAG: hypothetical protein Ct9H90mP16_22130 [Candidatus Poseidoniales archaeon]
MTPFENELNGIFDKGVSPNGTRNRKMLVEINWKQSAPSPNHLGLNMAYEVENAAGVQPMQPLRSKLATICTR